MKNYEEAIICYDEAIKSNPKCEIYHNNKGESLRCLK